MSIVPCRRNNQGGFVISSKCPDDFQSNTYAFRCLVNTQDPHDKYYMIEYFYNNSTTKERITYGRIGTTQKVRIRDLSIPRHEIIPSILETILSTKFKKGYIEIAAIDFDLNDRNPNVLDSLTTQMRNYTKRTYGANLVNLTIKDSSGSYLWTQYNFYYRPPEGNVAEIIVRPEHEVISSKSTKPIRSIDDSINSIKRRIDAIYDD